MNLLQPNHLCREPRSSHIRLATASLAIAMLSATSALLPTQSVRAESAQVIEEIVVTARKREESLQETPVVISALSARTISDFAIESVQDIADFTPGLISDGQGNPAGGILFLRGIGSASTNPAIEQAVSLVVDDMQMGSLLMQKSAMIDMQAVQVYKGPQALFFGKNSPGGVLSIKTADPGDEFEAQLKTGYEAVAEEWYVQGMVSGPFSDTAAGRLVFRYTDSDGFWDVESGSFPNSLGGSAPETESVFARGTLVLTPTDDLSIRAKLTYNEFESNTGGTDGIQRIHCPLGFPQVPLGAPEPFECKANDTIQRADFSQSAIDALAGEGIRITPSGRLDNEQLLATVALDYQFSDEFRLSSITGYYDITDFQLGESSFGLVPAPALGAQDFEFQQFTQELRLASEFSSPVNFVTGAYFEKKEHASIITVPVDARLFGSPVEFWVIGGVAEFVQDTEAASAFVDVTWDITESLELSGGARYSWEEKEFDGVRGYLDDAKADWDDVSPQVTLSYSVNDEWMLFASYREGFKSGGFDGAFKFVPVAATQLQYEPESVKGFEVGAKGTLLDNTLQLNAAIFDYEYDELQLGRFDPTTISLFIVNAAGAEISGVEVDFVWVTPADGLQIRGAITYLDSEFSEFVSPCWTGQTISQGCNLDFTPVTGAFNSQDLGGEPLNLAAEFGANLGFLYEQELGGVRLGLAVDAIYSDGYETSTGRQPNTRQDSYAKINAAVRLSSLDDAWSVALVGRNLADEYTFNNGGASPNTGFGTGTNAAIPADSIAYVGRGRAISVEFEYNF